MNPQDVAQQTSMIVRLVMEYAPPIIGALAVLVAGWMIANWLRRFVAAALEKTKVDATLRPVLASVARYIALGVTLMVVLQQFGVQTASLLALVGTIGLAIGLALQGTLSNVAAGLMLLFLRPFEVGNHVEAGGAEGIVLGIDLFHTNLRTVDGVDIVIPNGAILSGAIRNMSAFPERVISTTVTVSADTDLTKAMAAAKAVLAANPKVQKDREHSVAIRALAGGAAELHVMAWVKNEDYRTTRSDLLQELRTRFDKAGLKLG
jgi:small conductance mechanosensitive channel